MSYNKKYKDILIIIFTCILLLLPACQKTPESEVVVNKGASSLDELVLEKADPDEEWAQTEDRIVWNETKSVNTEMGGCTVTVSMDVETPADPGQVPVYLIAPGDFKVDFLKKVANYLLEGEKYDGTLSKQDFTAQRLEFEKVVSEHTILDTYQSEIDEWRESINKDYDKAPENNQKAKFEFVENEDGHKEICVKSYSDDNSIMRFSSYVYDTGYSDDFFFRVIEFMRSFRYLNEISGENIQADGTEITYDQALATANNALATFFEEPFAMVHASITDKTNYLEYLWNDRKVTSLGQAYVFCYTREYDGFPSLYIDPAPIFFTEKTEFAKPYVREYAQVVVDDSGIIDMTYKSFSETIEKLNDNVKLMSFEDILEQFKSDVFYHSLWGSAEVEITKIEFGMVREPVKDNPNQYMMVPAWNFIGNVKSSYVEGQSKSILALNAINGGIITDYEYIADPK